MRNITVQELIDKLSIFNPNATLEIVGGEFLPFDYNIGFGWFSASRGDDSEPLDPMKADGVRMYLNDNSKEIYYIWQEKHKSNV